MITELHWSQRRVCAHTRTTYALLPCANDTVQIRLTCIDCGHRVGPPERNADHPNRRRYPGIELCLDKDRRDSMAKVAPGEYDDYLASDEWAVRRTYYVAKAMGRCQICNKPGGPNGRGLNAHHRTYARVGAELDADVVVLCRDCHALFHGKLASESEEAA